MKYNTISTCSSVSSTILTQHQRDSMCCYFEQEYILDSENLLTFTTKNGIHNKLDTRQSIKDMPYKNKYIPLPLYKDLLIETTKLTLTNANNATCTKEEDHDFELLLYQSRLESLRKGSIADERKTNPIDISTIDVCLMSTDQSGCRMLQELIANKKINTEEVYNKIKTNLTNLITDPFGNYLCQKIYAHSDSVELKLDFIKRIKKDLDIIGINLHGSRALQTIITISSDSKKMINYIVDSIILYLRDFIINNNANHLVQQVMSLLSGNNKFIDDINSIISEDFVKIATNKYGCCIVQRIMDYNITNFLDNKKIVDFINENIYELVKDQYGNYIIQYSLTKAVSDKTVERLLSNFETLSTMKYSSNVIENVNKLDQSVLKLLRKNN